MSGSKGAAIDELLMEFEQQVIKGHGGATLKQHAQAKQAILALLAQEVKIARIDELEGFLERTVHKDKQPGDLDKDGNRMQMKVRTGYNYAKAEMRHDIKDRLERLG